LKQSRLGRREYDASCTLRGPKISKNYDAKVSLSTTPKAKK